MKEKLKCPYCGSDKVTRMDGSGIVKKYGASVMIDIAPEFVHCNNCNKDFKNDLFFEVAIADNLLEK